MRMAARIGLTYDLHTGSLFAPEEDKAFPLSLPFNYDKPTERLRVTYDLFPKQWQNILYINI